MNHIKVAVGILINAKKEVFIAQRSSKGKYPLKWEFPGGKVERNESFEQAVIRELQEELGIIVQRPLVEFHGNDITYDDGGAYSVRFFVIDSWEKEITNNVWEQCAFEQMNALQNYDMLEGNREVIALLQAHYS